jgi:MoaA/NifB/PqqE/SkfB family radical SAM enzyme
LGKRHLPTYDVLRKDAQLTAGILRGRPFDVLLQVTNRCNMQCSFCDFWDNPAPKGQELTLAEFQRIASELSELGTFIVSIEGGEPFLRKDLVDIVRAFSKDHITALFTSGWYVSEDNARALWDAGLTHASVSIDFSDPARHDKKRKIEGTTERAWRAVDIFRDTAPHGGRQVNVMSVLMNQNWLDMEALFLQSRAHAVGHQVTLLSTGGTRRAAGEDDELPPLGVAAHMTTLFDKYAHVRFFREYFERLDAFVSGGPMPTCHAGEQAFNIDHVGNVASCIERIGQPVGNVRDASLVDLHRRLRRDQPEVAECQKCWTACRGIADALGGGGSVHNLIDLGQRTRSY